MAQNQIRAKYEQMKTAELEALLCRDIEEDILDADTLFVILDILKTRNETEHFVELPSVDNAWRAFQQERSLRFEDSADEVTSQNNHLQKIHFAWARPLGQVIAAMLALILLATFTANAFGHTLWELSIVEVDDGVSFLFETSDIAEKQSLLEAELERHQIHEAILPKWAPNGYTLATFKTENIGDKIAFYLTYQGATPDDVIEFSFREILDLQSDVITRDETPIERYSAGGREHYIMKEHELRKAFWITDTCECYLTGNLSLVEMQQIIDSIYL